MQYQAGYILEAVKEELNTYARSHQEFSKLYGLLGALSTFDVLTTADLEIPSDAPSVLAVAHNILTRGLPTLGSIAVERHFAQGLAATTESQSNGKIKFQFRSEMPQVGYHLFKALHFIDPRARSPAKFLRLNNLDSDFERNFLLKIIPGDHSHLVQLLDRQRPRSSFTRDNNNGRVDFSLDIPYILLRSEINRFNEKIEITYWNTYIVEVDGKKFHKDSIDQLKDFAVARMPDGVSHIREDSVSKDVQSFIRAIDSESYIHLIKTNFNDDTYLSSPVSALLLSPFGIARIQSVLLRYLMANHHRAANAGRLKLAVVERDFPCAKVALDDLIQTLQTLNDLASSQAKITIPSIDLSVFASEEFISHPLHFGNKPLPIDRLVMEDYDLIIDVSVLRRSCTFSDDLRPSVKTVVIRSSHYTHYQTTCPVISAPLIPYKPLVNPLPNEVFEPIDAQLHLIESLLQNIFRKVSFREGQLPILNRAMQLKSVIGLLPTGGGKSLTYQLAALLQPGITIIIDPIRSLMVDQYEGLRDISIDKCGFVNSTLAAVERQYIQNELLTNGRLQFIFVSPERFVIKEFREALDEATKAKQRSFFAYAVIDEVHCVSEWGHDFRVPYLNLGENAQKHCLTFNGRPIPLIGLTATASFDVLADIERELKIKEDDGNAVVRYENTVRDEITYVIQSVSVDWEGVQTSDKRKIREAIGIAKQGAAYEIINRKQDFLERFNSEEALNNLVGYSYEMYLPVSMKQRLIARSENAKKAKENYVRQQINSLRLFTTPFEVSTESYNYGCIVFAPHRTGPIGVQNLYNDKVQTSIQTLEGRHIHYYQQERLGFFIGSGDQPEATHIDEESFFHLREFKENREAIMIATKAFGMGIDKPNVRLTIHLNSPQSIESFVQEAGRAARDGKMSASVVLYNDDQIVIGEELYHDDKDVLMYFHRRTFKGEVKERVMIHELRSKITFPNTSNLQLVTQQLNRHIQGGIQNWISIKLDKKKQTLYLNDELGSNLGRIDLDTKSISFAKTLKLSHQVLETTLRTLIPLAGMGAKALANWLDKTVVNSNFERGLEAVLQDMEVGDVEKIVEIPFTNKYYSKNAGSAAQSAFGLNIEHLKLLENSEAASLIKSHEEPDWVHLTSVLTDAVKEGYDYAEFLRKLNIRNEQLRYVLLNPAHPVGLGLQRAYYAPRGAEDTARAIFRLVSIGVIDSYTIDYNAQVYRVALLKKESGSYYQALKDLVARYTSKKVAADLIENLRIESKPKITAGKATEMSVCLEFLTGFIYDKIKKKRQQAIDDMISLCRTAISIDDQLEQSKAVKDEIFFYFNAKYTRRGYRENESGASMPDDLDNLSIGETINKYINLVEDETTGEFISNIKHLRGSAMRMLRSYPDRPQYRILKAFALFVLADSIAELKHEAVAELSKGLVEWKRETGAVLNLQTFLPEYKRRLKGHILQYDVDECFHEVEDIYYSLYYSDWTIKFNEQFLS